MNSDGETRGGAPTGSAAKPSSAARPAQQKVQPRYERRVLLLALLTGGPGVVVSLALLWGGDFTLKVNLTLTALVVSVWLAGSAALVSRVVRPLQTVSNLLAALREGDFSIRARGARGGDALGEVFYEVNALGEILREQRLGALEATALLRTVMAEIDVAVFAFDGEERLRLVNRAGERLLADASERLLGRTAAELGLSECLRAETDDAPHVLQREFPGGEGRRKWGVRRSEFRERGLPHRLLVVSDLSAPLREEERTAWQRLVRVLGHELNNSLAPIKSIAGSLSSLLAREPLPADWREDAARGLEVVSARAESLARFINSYSKLARLPPPRLTRFEIGALMRRVVELETRTPVELLPGPELSVEADQDQLEQLLINLLRNAAEAGEATGGRVRATWTADERHLEIVVEDEGLGLAATSNLFVPFYTTKPGGTGIGLVLSRQIAEAHNGALTLENRTDGPGCEARLRLPLKGHDEA